MRWTTRHTNVYRWHKWFAWRPVRVYKDQTITNWVWCEWIYRIRQEGWGGGSWSYKTREDYLEGL